jgi:adenylate cyclase
MGLLVGIVIGLSLGFFESFLLPARFRQKPFAFLQLVRTTLYAGISAFWLLTVFVLLQVFTRHLAPMAALQEYVSNGRFALDFGFSVLFCFLLVAGQQISRLHGPGELIKFVTGAYHQPREEARIFLFVDLKSSTTLAEQLGPLMYSRFVQDFFYDLTDAIILTKAEVYQYVGDEVVLTWPLAKGCYQARCVQCFYLMQAKVVARRASYERSYGVYPQFKAGLHSGLAVVTWVGEVKREMVYHGDVLNVAARIQALCNELGQELLISEALLNQLTGLEALSVQAVFMSTLQLRGRQQMLDLYGLRQVTVAPL